MAPALQSNKDRIVAVDITRLMAAFIVMYEHLAVCGQTPSINLLWRFQEMLVHRVSPVFFFLAGYFACRNLTWKKALNNAVWCFAPYILWNLITFAVAYAASGNILHHETLSSLGAFASNVLGFTRTSDPLDFPLWFMRDLTVLFIFSPILFKFAKYILPVILIIAVIPSTAPYTARVADSFLSLNSIAFFSAGCFLQTLGKDLQQKALSFYSPKFILTYVIVIIGALVLVKNRVIPWPPYFGFLQNALSILFLYQTARWLETRCPWLKNFALKFAPVTFLTFAAHISFFILVPARFINTGVMLMLPIAVFFICSAIFFALKRWCRPLLHLVAHYKLRAEDVKKQA